MGIISKHSMLHLLTQVDRQAQFIQGYRVMYRPKSSAWLVQDVKSPAERSTVLIDLRKGQEYEIKIRPYFDEFQGMDSEVLLVHTPEEGTYGRFEGSKGVSFGSGRNNPLNFASISCYIYHLIFFYLLGKP